MARKVKIERRTPKFDFAECKLAGQGKEVGKAWGVSIGVWSVQLFLILQLGTQQQQLIFYFFGWVLACWFMYFFMLPRIARRRLIMQGLKIKVMGNNYPDIKRLLTAQCRVLGIKEPECYVVNEPIAHATALGMRQPYFLVVTAMLQGLLTPEEFAAAVQRALLHARLGQARPLMLIAFMNQTPAPLRMAFAPLWLYEFILQLEWSTMAEISCDRAWVVLNRNPRLCAGTLIKMAASADPTINATPAEVDNLFKQKNLMEQSVVELGSTYKLQNLLHENKFISERFQELIEFAESDQAVALAQKMDEALKAANLTM